MAKPITRLLLGAMLLFAAVVNGQKPTFTLTPQTFTKNVGDTVKVAVKVSDFQSIFSMQYGIHWRNTVLQLDSIKFPTPLALTNANLDASAVVSTNVGSYGFVNTAWLDNTFDGQNLPNGTTLYTLYFKVLTASSDTIAFGKTSNNLNIEIGSAVTGGNVGMTQNNSIKVGVTPPPAGWALLTDPATGQNGDVITVPVKVQQFTKITLMQYYCFWDKTKLEFQGVQDINLQDMSSGNFIPSPITTPANITQAANAGRLGTSWFDMSPNLTGVTVPDNTAIYKLKFKLIGAAGTSSQITFGPLPPNFPAEVANPTASLTFQAVPCTVTITAPPQPTDTVTFNLSTLTLQPGQTGLVDCTVKNFKSIVSAQFYIKFDKNQLTYNGPTVFTSPADLPTTSAFGTVANANSTGVIDFGYITAGNPTVGATVPDNTKIFSLSFTAKANSTPPIIVPITMGANGGNPVEVSIANGVSGLLVTPKLNNGSVTIEPVPVNPCNNLQVVIDATENVKCFGQSNGSISITASGGTGGTWNYQWTGPTGTINGIADITNLKAGTYNLTATYSNPSTSCPAVTKTVTITEPAAITIPTQNVTNVKCFGGMDGCINITPAGGTAPLTFKWSGPNGFSATTQNICNLKAGTYQVTITDANGCSTNTPITVSQPTAMSQNSSAIVVTNVKCFGGSDGTILLNNAVSGGTQPYTYSWSGPNGYTAQTKDIGGLKTGQYTVTVTDANGCTPLIIGPMFVAQPATDVAVTISSTKDVSCFGGSDGEICVSVTGGTSPYTYAWPGQGANQTASCLKDRVAGNYFVVVTDASGCSKSQNATINGPISGIGQTGLNVSQVSCNGGKDGSICINIAGGSPPYTYNWGGGQTTSNCNNNIGAGSYSVTVTDSKGCTYAATGIQVTEPQAISLTTAVTIPTGCIDLTVSGGTGPFTYLWSPSGSGVQDPCGLPAGIHTVTVTDAKGCTKTTSAQLGSSMTMNLAPGKMACFGEINGSCIVTVNGGQTPYTINWTNGANTGSVTTSTSPYEIGGLAGGSATFVTVTDAQGGSATGQVFVNQNPALSANTTVTNSLYPNFNSGSMLIEMSSGTPPYTFKWTKNGQPITSNITSGADTSKVFGQDEGHFCVVVTDANGCSKEFCKDIKKVYQPMTVVANPSFPPCATSNSGSITLTITGGDGNYSVVWTLANGSTTTNKDLTNLLEGTYSYVVKDGSGQIVSDNKVLAAQSHLSASALVNSVCGIYSICTKSICDGVATVTTTGQFGNVTYTWSNGESTQTANELCAGTNCVTVADAAGCKDTFCINITAPEVIEVGTIVPIANTCFGICNGSAQINPIGGVPPYKFQWTSGETGQIATKLCSGINYYTVTDNFGITAVDSFLIDGPGPLSIDFTLTPPSDYETCDGVVVASVINAQLPIPSYAWNKPGEFDDTVDVGCAGEILYLSVKDARGCVVADTVQVPFPKNGCLVGNKVMTPALADGKNDVLFIACAEGYNGTQLEVYNRWGQQVYIGKDYQNDWDGTYRGEAGKYLPEGTYFWIFSFDTPTGRVQRKDYVTILRGGE